ncbi:undecaprenyl-diphosphate phosphatase [Undibacterium fentianense]|uniref:Undecaprenyl-diphosphatase n=1 Tax=Undibacterium fentianense TaxID=2828728 RepID=A0A941E577_9BURK|nr:undecaprenyl-diphosphate phosphatase [Undibacterium fentianense]MBR7799948.1 undecaprenyl-diphosphate phosphatase [Undibacterium fentianense]
MDFTLAIKIIIMGIVEGLTEFLPISSTGHLILAGSLLNFTGEKIKVFEIVIQAGAIFAVCWEYRSRIAQVLRGLTTDVTAQRFALHVSIAFLPAAILGLLFSKQIKAHLFKPEPVAAALILGGIFILWTERKHRQNLQVRPPQIETVDDMRLIDAFKIGLAQSLALIPGTSRSGASIIGAMWFGMSRKAATEFSFFLAIPTLLGATIYSLYKARSELSVQDIPMFGLGTLAAFISAFFCVRWLLKYVSTHSFNAFAWYRIAFGCMILLTAYTGVISWAE